MPGWGRGKRQEIKMEWGTGFSEGRFFPPQTTKTSFSSVLKGRQVLRAEWDWE